MFGGARRKESAGAEAGPMNLLNLKTIKHNPLFISSLAISIALHALILGFFYTHPVMLQRTLCSLFNLSNADPSLLENEEETQKLSRKNEMLEEVFEQILILSPHFQQPFDLVELPKGMALAPSTEHFKPILLPDQEIQLQSTMEDAWTTAFVPSFSIEKDIAAPDVLSFAARPPPVAFSFQVTPPEDMYNLEQLGLDEVPIIQELLAIGEQDIDPAYEIRGNPSHLAPSVLGSDRLSQLNSFELKIDISLKTAAPSFAIKPLHEPISFCPLRVPTKIDAPRLHIDYTERDLDDFIFSTLPFAAEWNDHFDLDLKFLPNPQGKGYIFSIALNPHFDLAQYSLRHNILFVIDRTSSIKKHRFNVFKSAVLKALASMQKGDTFNILLVDKKITFLSPKSLPVSSRSIGAAEEFLQKQESTALFSTADIYSSLEKILPQTWDENAIHTAILITDGISEQTSEKQKQIFKNWIEKSNGALSLYTAAVGQKNDLLMLDLLSNVSGGRLLWSDTHASFPRKLAKLVLDLRDPVANHVLIEAIAQNSGAHLSFSSGTFLLPVLFSHQPFTIMGSIDNPCPFDLIIQAQHLDEWIAIKKTVSFIEGKKGDRSLEREWAAQKALSHYEKFLNEGNVAHLKEAKEILKKNRSEIAFE